MENGLLFWTPKTKAMQYSPQFSVKDRVSLTTQGARTHREHHIKEKAVSVAAVAAVAAPVAIGGGVGLAAGGGAIGVGATAQGAAGAAAGGLGGAAAMAFSTFPEAGAKGTIVEKQGRWWGQGGHDYKVEWDEECGGGSSWHLSKHLEKLS